MTHASDDYKDPGKQGKMPEERPGQAAQRPHKSQGQQEELDRMAEDIGGQSRRDQGAKKADR